MEFLQREGLPQHSAAHVQYIASHISSVTMACLALDYLSPAFGTLTFGFERKGEEWVTMVTDGF